MKKNKPLKVSIVMGSQSDYKTMQLAEKTLKKIGVSFETKIISAHRTPKRMYEYAAAAQKNNIGVIITDHNVREALKIVDYAHIIYNGSLIREGHPSEIVKDEFVKKIYLGQDYQD